VVGASGSGKTTIMRMIMKNELVSFTTRAPRIGEINGKDYIFITKDEFTSLLESGGLMESTEYGGNHYGLTRKEFEYKLEIGDAFFICDINGMKQMKSLYDNCLSIFIYADKEDIHQRMIVRGDKEELILKRLSTHEEEIQNMKFCDHVVVNDQDNIDNVVGKILTILEGIDGRESW
jgi:guanylate kinase